MAYFFFIYKNKLLNLLEVSYFFKRIKNNLIKTFYFEGNYIISFDYIKKNLHVKKNKFMYYPNLQIQFRVL